ncbi:MAG: DUF4382 domain-containing protein, partial [Dehalococcoidia bacterium]|nr:DUF4382 domain-containing protein [Dehalococcoidia bacterium]
EDNKWVNILPGPMEFDLIKVSDVEQVLGASSVGPGNYSQVKLQVTEASVNLGTQKVIASIPNTELRLSVPFRVEAGKTTVLTIDFDAEKSLTLTGEGKATLNPVAKLVAGEPATEVPSLRLNGISKTGIIATIPGYTTIDVSQFQGLVNTAYPGLLPKQIQLFVLLTQDDEAYLVLGMDTNIDRYITAATVEGKRIPPLQGIPTELDWAGKVILSNRVKLLDPIATSPDLVNANPSDYAFKRVVMNSTYVFGSGRLKNSQVLKHIGFALATNKFGSANRNDYLTVVDPYNTETQIRVADIYGTVLYPTNAVRSLLSQAYRFAPEDVKEMLDKPTVFFENFKDDESQLVTIGELVPTPKDPTIKMPKYHGKMVNIEGIAIGETVKTEDIPQLSNSPIHFTIKAIGVADLTGAMPIIGISSEDTGGEVFGHYRFELSIYRFEGDKAYAFLINKKATPLDPITQVERAGFGNRVKSSLNDYLVMKVGSTKLASNLVLEQVDLLLPLDTKNPIIMTRHPNLSNGDYLKT